MQEQSIESFQFDDRYMQELFETLVTRIKYSAKNYSEQDFKVDLVLKMSVPTVAYIPIAVQTPFDQIFKNTPPIYSQMYSLVQQYIHYLLEKNNQCLDTMNPPTRKMTTLYEANPFTKRSKLRQGQMEERIIDIQCKYEYLPKLDTFTLQYNMIMVILQRICGFKVKTFMLQDDQIGEPGTHVYFLISQSNENLMKVASKFKIKKQINMANLDFSINQPVDSAGRPLKVNSFFKEPQSQGLYEAIKRLNRELGISNKAINQDIVDQVFLSESQLQQFQLYFQQLQSAVKEILTPKDTNPKQNLYVTHLNGRQQTFGTYNSGANQRYDMIRKFKSKISQFQREYLYTYNRHKLNKGCEAYMLRVIQKKKIFNKIIELNKKYNYKFNQYKDTFVQFILPNRKKPFFQKLAHLLHYQWYQNTPDEELSMFTTMQRIKLAFLTLQQSFKIQNLKKIGLKLFAISSQYQLFAKINHYYKWEVQYSQHNLNIQKKAQSQQFKCVQKLWHPFIAFKTDIRAVRDYMGDSFAFQLAFKVHMITYLWIMVPISLGFQIGLLMYYGNGGQKQYIYDLAQIITLFFSYQFLIQLWKKKQNKYFNNYISTYQVKDIRSKYRGPYVRSIINDSPNTFQTGKSFQHYLRTNISILVYMCIFAAEGLCFWGIRKLIISNYTRFPFVYLISTAHLSFYSLFFIINYAAYQLLIMKIMKKLVNIQNYAKTSEHDSAMRRLNNFYNFGLELIGPIFFYVIQPFNRTSCYAASCLTQFQNYIISRYIIIISIVLFKNILIVYQISLRYFKKQAIFKTNSLETTEKNTFQYKLNQLLKHIQFQSYKNQVFQSLIQEMSVFFFYSIFFIRFPFGQIVSCFALTLSYSIKRYQSLYLKSRPIPNSRELFRYSQIMQRLYYISLLLNSWTIVFSYPYLQYDLSILFTVFIPNLKESNMLTFKLAAAVALFVAFLALTQIFKQIAGLFGQSNILEKRKMNKFKQFISNAKGKAYNKKIKQELVPMKTIFRTYEMQFVIDYKKNKFNFLRQKFRSPAQAADDKLVTEQKGLQKSILKQPQFFLRKSIVDKRVLLVPESAQNINSHSLIYAEDL